MKNALIKTGLITALLIGLTLVLFTACDDIIPISARDRMILFIADANAEKWSELKKHTHPDASAYNTADAGFWETNMDTYLELIGPVMSGNTATVTGAGPVTFTFSLKEDGKKNYKIYRILRGATIIFE